jgi:Flp pilus assembly protein protease CpaA
LTLSTAFLIVWSAVAAGMDLQRRRVRWWWSLIGLIGAGGFRIITWISSGINPEEVLIIFIAVTASYSIWRTGWWGGADGKTAMTLVIAIPDLIFIAVLASVSLLASALRLVARRGQRSLAQVAADALQAVREDVHEGERFPLVAVMVGALPIYLFFAHVVP